ncbi:MAG TPA: 2-amino-4-hydroxy-6-hydroxymethyldihydropteridine diphosphokinase [Candidatus Acidoferrales bacterium]|nr:2-amino-4-hydroxy-6-hydroxymethyldihydropteridine diphosphokinase [Candidatus Acidoferrales bacterium]
MTKTYLSLGSNIGDRRKNIAQAIDALLLHGVRVLRKSSLYETEPVEMTDQPWFVNCVVEAETDLQPDELMETLLSIEREMGRERLVPKGPRLIDIDILLYDAQALHTSKVEIPHPRMTERKFVLAPLAEIAPDVRHPVLNKTAAELAEGTPDQSEIRKLTTDPGKVVRKEDLG